MGDGFVKVIRWFEEKMEIWGTEKRDEGEIEWGEKMCVEASPVSILLLFN